MLSGSAIKDAIAEGLIVIEPFDESRLNPNSYNLRLSDRLLCYKLTEYCGEYCRGNVFGLDMKKKPETMSLIIPQEGLWLLPGTLYLGSTVEYTETHPPYVPAIDGRSSIGRLGMQIHLTAGFGDCGFCGTWTLEIAVIHPLKIYPNIEICQISYTRLDGPVKPYSGYKYQGQIGPQPSRLWEDLLNSENAH